MMIFLTDWLVQTWAVTVEAAPWLLAGFLLAGVIHAWVPVGRIATHLGKSSVGGVLKAAVLGVPLPLCSCSVIPLASAMRRSGASRGATAGFLVSTPETGVDSISITYALLGPVMAVLRPVAAFISAVVAGLLINRFAPEDSPGSPGVSGSGSSIGEHSRKQEEGCCCSCECSAGAPLTGGPADLADESTRPSFVARLASAVEYGFSEMFADLAIWLVIGFILAGLISVLVPPQFLETHLISGWLAMPAAVAIGLPLYVCATSSTPIAAALMAKGLSPGTALVFLLVGPATNIATMVVVGKELGRRSLVIYLLSISVVAVGLGILVDLALFIPTLHALRVNVVIDETKAWWEIALAVAFAALLANGLRARYWPRKNHKADRAPQAGCGERATEANCR